MLLCFTGFGYDVDELDEFIPFSTLLCRFDCNFQLVDLNTCSEILRSYIARQTFELIEILVPTPHGLKNYLFIGAPEARTKIFVILRRVVRFK